AVEMRGFPQPQQGALAAPVPLELHLQARLRQGLDGQHGRGGEVARAHGPTLVFEHGPQDARRRARRGQLGSIALELAQAPGVEAGQREADRGGRGRRGAGHGAQKLAARAGNSQGSGRAQLRAVGSREETCSP
ncbi:MAG: hypothetical protein ACK56I_30770, partial [bacterium]